MSRILVIAAHPDDEVLGCGGTISKSAKKNEIYVCILGEGISARHETRNQDTIEEINSIREHSRKACEILGVKKVFYNELPDNQFDSVSLLDVVRIIEKMISDIQPDIVYTHHCSDLNIDHGITNRATLTATRPIAGNPVKELYAYEVLSSSEWSFYNFKPSFSPNTFVDISGTLEIKKQALLSYQSELRSFPHPRSLDAVETAAKHWGSVSGCKAAEAFELIRAIR